MIGDLEGEGRIANWKTRDALTKHLKFVKFHRGQLAAPMPILHTKGIYTLVKMATGTHINLHCW